MQQGLIKRTAVCGLVFFLMAMGMIFAVAAGREKISGGPEEAAEEEGPVQEESGPVSGGRDSLLFETGTADTGYLRIPLPEECAAENILIENYYVDRELVVFVPGAGEAFYTENSISGNCERIRRGSFAMTEGGAVLDLQLTGIYECRTILEDGNLYIRFWTPTEIYDRIVVIDPACGGSDPGHEAEGITEKDINLRIAQRLKERLDESGIKAYYTRLDDSNPAAEKRTALGNETGADMYIRIRLEEREDPAEYGIEAGYRSDYFIPGFGSRELAGLLDQEVKAAVNGKSLGLSEIPAEEETLSGLEVPAVCISAGCISNRQEALLLGREEYIDKIAEGIYNAILKGYRTETFR